MFLYCYQYHYIEGVKLIFTAKFPLKTSDIIIYSPFMEQNISLALLLAESCTPYKCNSSQPILITVKVLGALH